MISSKPAVPDHTLINHSPLITLMLKQKVVVTYAASAPRNCPRASLQQSDNHRKHSGGWGWVVAPAHVCESLVPKTLLQKLPLNGEWKTLVHISTEEEIIAENEWQTLERFVNTKRTFPQQAHLKHDRSKIKTKGSHRVKGVSAHI